MLIDDNIEDDSNSMRPWVEYTTPKIHLDRLDLSGLRLFSRLLSRRRFRVSERSRSRGDLLRRLSRSRRLSLSRRAGDGERPIKPWIVKENRLNFTVHR